MRIKNFSLEVAMPHPLAGQPAPRKILTNIPRLVSAYYTEQPNPEEIAQQVAFGTSGHRGTSLQGSFNEDHILAVCQALVEYRQQAGITGPLFIGKDTHALSEPAEQPPLKFFPPTASRSVLQMGSSQRQ